MDLIGQPSGRGVEGGQIEDGDKGDRDVEVSGSTSKITKQTNSNMCLYHEFYKAFGIYSYSE